MLRISANSPRGVSREEEQESCDGKDFPDEEGFKAGMKE